MRRFPTLQRILRGLALLAVCLRVAVPAGYMPATALDGFYLQWCPDGVSAGFMAALHGAADGARHAGGGHHREAGNPHHHEGGTNAEGAGTGHGAEGASRIHCDLAGASADALASVPHVTVASPGRLPAAVLLACAPARAAPRLAYRSRAPPPWGGVPA